jgi:hypothetical protein
VSSAFPPRAISHRLPHPGRGDARISEAPQRQMKLAGFRNFAQIRKTVAGPPGKIRGRIQIYVLDN